MDFYRDFFGTDIMNHLEFLKNLTDLDKDDHHLLVSVLEHLSSRSPVRSIVPFYEGHVSKPKSVVRILRSYILLKRLKGHDYNIFELAFLEGPAPLLPVFNPKFVIKFTAFFTLLCQILLFTILVYTNSNPTMSKDKLVYVITFATTNFFVSMAQKQLEGCTRFNRCFFLTGDPKKSLYLYMNFISNFILPCLTVYFNIYFVLLSPDSNTAILNSMALYFILDMDSMILPPWSEERIQNSTAVNIHKYITANSDPDPTVAKLHNPTTDVECDLSEETKVYVSIEKNVITVFSRKNSTEYDATRYVVQEDCASAPEFLSLVRDFSCVQNYLDIHT